MKPKELIKILKENGWEVKNQKGSHIQLINKERSGKVTIPYHNKDLKVGTLKSIFKQAGL